LDPIVPNLLAPALRAKAKKLQQKIAQLKARNAFDETEFFNALTQYGARHHADFMSGVFRYRQSPIHRTLQDPLAVWEKGSTRLLDFGTKDAGDVVLVIPSLINRYTILDLDEKQSFVRALAARGYHPYLLDWNVPGQEELGFDIDDYIGKRLLHALEWLFEKTGKRVHVVGYCMGGLLAAAAAMHAEDKIRSLMFLATPWDFHAGEGTLAQRVEEMLPVLQPLLDAWGYMPVDVLQCFFISQQPFYPLEKFQKFNSMKEESPAFKNFVLLEDWVNDGVPLARKVTDECFSKWYVENAPVRETWSVLDKQVLPATLSVPSLHVIPQRDKIVPPESAKALARLMQDSEMRQPSFGHVSMMGHPAAPHKLWPQLFDWLDRVSGKP
jgi:polyhydroxyalkanoate synthase